MLCDDPERWQGWVGGRLKREGIYTYKVFEKATYIYNCVPANDARERVQKMPYSKRGNVVVYVGSLVPYKGFHLLAQAWPQILKCVPDAELYVIGSGKLYNEKNSLGKWKLAESSYEELFMPYLVNGSQIIPSVHFMGVMGKSKEEILLKSRVGVPNPSGITETFCLSAVEMQMCGCRIATINYPGYLDTVKNGKLYGRKESLAEVVASLLRSTENHYESAMSYFENNFSFDSVSEKWEELLLSGEVRRTEKIHNLRYRLKWLKEFMRIIKHILPFMYRLPMLERVLIFFERKRFGKVTYIDS